MRLRWRGRRVHAPGPRRAGAIGHDSPPTFVTRSSVCGVQKQNAPGRTHTAINIEMIELLRQFARRDSQGSGDVGWQKRRRPGVREMVLSRDCMRSMTLDDMQPRDQANPHTPPCTSASVADG
jgi:hypothetical protein